MYIRVHRIIIIWAVTILSSTSLSSSLSSKVFCWLGRTRRSAIPKQLESIFEHLNCSAPICSKRYNIVDARHILCCLQPSSVCALKFKHGETIWYRLEPVVALKTWFLKNGLEPFWNSAPLILCTYLHGNNIIGTCSEVIKSINQSINYLREPWFLSHSIHLHSYIGCL